MTATDELRRMLDEAGVEWGNIRNDGSESEYLTEWQFDGIQGYAVAIEWAVGGGLSLETHRHHLTPAQAIAATLGASERESYDAGFASGVKATLQQLYGLLHEYPTLDEIEAWADSQWEVPE